MTTIEARHTTPAKQTKSSVSAKGENTKTAGRASSAHINPSKSASRGELHTARVTKHDRILTLLSRREGATIPEMMEASGWQQHSVRGFLAGTVKKKLGFTLTSAKRAGELRRYSIDSKRGR
ncbi:MAG: DUF3489 domain-containing protein [Hyphomicrobiaceae bacterium]